MKIIHYIKGDRKGRSAHNIEREMLSKPFLYEAIEGYERHHNNTEFAKDINELQKEITTHSFVKQSRWIIWAAVGVGAVVVVTLLYLFIFKDNFSRGKWTTQKVNPSESVMQVKPDIGAEPVKAMEKQPQDVIVVGDDNKEEEKTNEEETESIAVEKQAVNEKQDIEESQEIEGGGEEPEKESISSKVVEERPVQQHSGTVGGKEKLIPILDLNSASNRKIEGENNYVTAPRTGVRLYSEYLKNACTLPVTSESGDVVISFRVNQYGRPSTMRIISSPSTDANREAIRLLDSGPEWHPTQDTVTVTIKFNK